MLNFLAQTFLLGLKNLRLHKLRSLLTALGIIFGVAAVIIMVAIGEGTKKAALEQLQQLGATNILLRSTLPPESNQASQRTQRILEYGLLRSDLELLKLLPGVTNIIPLRNTEQKVTRGDIRSPASAVATIPQAVQVIAIATPPLECWGQVRRRSCFHMKTHLARRCWSARRGEAAFR